jgi:cystathionine gamma-synthase/methionine-gamma-lyase
MSESSARAFATRAVHAGERQPPDGAVPVSSPLYPSVGYTYPSMERLDAVLGAEEPGYVYSARYGNPTVAAFETAVADLEGGAAAHAFASGMAAMHAALLAVGVAGGAHVVAAADVYGATYTLLSRHFRAMGATVHLVDVSDLAAVETALARHRPVALVVETISNPLLKVADLPALGRLARAQKTPLIVDNTFASPYLCRPLAHGATLVVHSATKYLAGHGDVMAGVVVGDAAQRGRLVDIAKLLGGTLGPFEAWLALRGLKTLPLRLRQQCAGALEVAGWLAAQPAVARVYFPGLPAHASHAVARRLLGADRWGGMVAFELRAGERAAAFRFMERLQLIQPATTLGDIYSLILHPATSSHRSLTAEARAGLGISEGLVRLSVGIEEPADIIEDLRQALAG